MIAYAFALLAGLATIGSPCILPVLPIVLATTTGRSRMEPALTVLGFVATFAAGGVLIGALSASSGALQQAVRTGAILVLLVAGLTCLWAAPFDWMMTRLQAIRRPRVQATPHHQPAGKLGALMVGASLGLAWTPCAGPVLASVLALAAAAQQPAKATALLAAYAIGAGIPLLSIAYGGAWIASRLALFHRHAARFRQLFGLVIIAVALLQLFQYDTAFIAWATAWLPSFSAGL
jgi:cytochrome c biogenesis protein CcdA